MALAVTGVANASDGYGIVNPKTRIPVVGVRDEVEKPEKLYAIVISCAKV